MLALLAINGGDMMRNITLVILCLVTHCWCSRRARNVRRGRFVRELPPRWRSPLALQIEQYYIQRELSRASARMVEKEFKLVKLNKADDIEVKALEEI